MNNNIDERLDEVLLAKWAKRREILIRLLKANIAGQKISPEQFTILDILGDSGHGLAVKEISEFIDLPHANITRTLDRLESKGLIRRSRNKTDRRQVIIRLTLEGNKLTSQLTEIKRRLYDHLWGNLPDREKTTLLELLTNRH